jgi:glycosyltransferase involved in cell wall biosynthesis
MAEQMRRLRGEAREFCLQTATPVGSGATVIQLRQAAEGLPHVLRPAARYWDFQKLLGAWRTVAEAIDGGDADVVVAHPCQVLQCPPALLHLAKRTVYFCHETRRVDYEPAAAASRNRATRPLYAGLYRWQRRTDFRGVQRATRVITNSRYTAAEIKRAYARDALPVALGVSDGFVPAPQREVPRHVLSVGSLIPSKGHDLAIIANSRSPHRWPVTIVAPRPNVPEEDRLRVLARELGVELRVTVGVPDLELRDLYRGAVATMYLALAEPLGLVSLEAQACGCPVIVSDEGGLPETLRQGITGWSVPRSADAAARRLTELEDQGLRARMSEAAAAHGKSFGWDASVRQLEGLLEATLASSSTDPRT